MMESTGKHRFNCVDIPSEGWCFEEIVTLQYVTGTQSSAVAKGNFSLVRKTSSLCTIHIGKSLYSTVLGET